MHKNLYDIFKHWYCNDGEHQNAIYFYSDPHFGDEELAVLRKNYIGDAEQVKRINSKVTKHDTLVILGDIGDVEWVKKIRAGRKVLIMGNHDKGASNYKSEIASADYNKLPSLRNYYNKNKERFIVPEKKTFKSDEELQDYLISIMANVLDEYYLNPFKNEGLFDEVYEGALIISPKIILSHEPVNFEFAFNIHGHDHSNRLSDDKHLNVCAEHIDYTPISLTQIVKGGALSKIPDMHRTTIDRAVERMKND